MCFRLPMLIVVSVLVATAGLANARVATGFEHTNILDQVPHIQLRHGSERAICPLYNVSDWYRDDVTHLDLSHLYDWAHPAETLEVTDKCAMPAPEYDVLRNVG